MEEYSFIYLTNTYLRRVSLLTRSQIYRRVFFDSRRLDDELLPVLYKVISTPTSFLTLLYTKSFYHTYLQIRDQVQYLYTVLKSST